MNEAEWLASEDPAAMLSILGTSGAPTGHMDVSSRKLRLFACACVRRVWHLLAEGSRLAVEVSERYAEGKATNGRLMKAGNQAQRALSRARGEAAERAAYAALSACDLPAMTAEVFRRLTPLLVSPAEIAGLLRCVVGNPFRPLPRLKLEHGAGWAYQDTGAALDFEGQSVPHAAWTRLQNDWLSPAALSLAGEAYEGRARPCPYCEDAPQLYDGSQWSGTRRRCACKGTRLVPNEGRTLDPIDLFAVADTLEERGCPQDLPCPCRAPWDGLWQSLAEASLAGGRVGLYGGAWTVKRHCPLCAERGVVANPILAHLRSPGPHVRGCWAVDLILGKE